MNQEQFEDELARDDILVQDDPEDNDCLEGTSPHGPGITVRKPKDDGEREKVCKDLIEHFRGQRRKRG